MHIVPKKVIMVINFSAVYKDWFDCLKLLSNTAVLDLGTIRGLHLVHIVTKF